MELCDQLRSLHRPGDPLILPNAWDATSARAVVAAGFPVVATTSGGVAASLGYEDHEHAPAQEMLTAAARICRSVDVPVTVDTEAGYGLSADDLVTTLRTMGAAGCNLEDTDHASGTFRDPADNAMRIRAVRKAASAQDYPLVINARIDVFLAGALAGTSQPQSELLDEALERARCYSEAGADCVFPIALWQPDALTTFVAKAEAPVNAVRFPRPGMPNLAELAGYGVARISHATVLHTATTEHLKALLGSLT